MFEVDLKDRATHFSKYETSLLQNPVFPIVFKKPPRCLKSQETVFRRRLFVKDCNLILNWDLWHLNKQYLFVCLWGCLAKLLKLNRHAHL